MRPALLVLALTLAAPQGRSAAEPAPQASLAERRQALAKMSKAELAETLRATSQADLIAIGRVAVAELGTYRCHLISQERVGGKLLEAQEADVVIRDKPLSALMDYVKGPAAGRRVLYNSSIEPQKIRVREAGLLGALALWIDKDGRLAKEDTNHTVSEIGFAALLDTVGSQVKRGEGKPGVKRIDEGYDAHGDWCIRTLSSPESGMYAANTLTCFDVKVGLPTRIEVFDAHEQLIERFEYRKVEPRLQLPEDFFTPKAAGL